VKNLLAPKKTEEDDTIPWKLKIIAVPFGVAIFIIIEHLSITVSNIVRSLPYIGHL
jgi:hypothetical protein